MKKAKHIVSGFVWAVIGLYILAMILLHIPAFQTMLGKKVSEALSEKFDTEVSVGRIDLGFANRIIVDDVRMKDKEGKEMLTASRLSAKIDIVALMNGNIAISSAQIFGMKGAFYKKADADAPNFQFVLDSLASKDTTKHTPLNLRIGSVVIRHSGFTYDDYGQPVTPNRFNVNHLNIDNISTHLLLPKLTDDSISLNLKRLSLTEASGLKIKDLALRLNASKKQMSVDGFSLALPNSTIRLDSLFATYEFNDGKLSMPTLRYEGIVPESSITPSDISCFVPELSKINKPIKLKTSVSGTSNMLNVPELSVTSDDGDFTLKASGSISNNNRWFSSIHDLHISSQTISFVQKEILNDGKQLPEEIGRLGDINFVGDIGGFGRDVSVKGQLATDAGNANVGIGLHGDSFTARLETNGLNIRQILDDDKFGILASNLDIDGNRSLSNIKVDGKVAQFDYDGYSYKNLNVNGTLNGKTAEGTITIDDPNIILQADGTVNFSDNDPTANISARVKHIVPRALKLTDYFEDGKLSADIDADIHGKSLRQLMGTVHLTNFDMQSSKMSYHLNNLTINAEPTDEGRRINMISDFAQGTITERNNFGFADLDVAVSKSDWLNTFFSLPVEISKPLHLKGSYNTKSNEIDMIAQLPHFTISGVKMNYDLKVKRDETGAINSRLSWDDGKPNPFKGTLNCTTKLVADKGIKGFHTQVHESEIVINDTAWQLRPSEIEYSNKHLSIDNFSISHNDQHLTINGLATTSPNDSLTVDMHGINVEYVLDLVNFDAVDFSGFASGEINVKSVFSTPSLSADLDVREFRFQDGRMGTLYAKADYNNHSKQIDIDAHADDVDGKTLIKGYISPERNYLDLAIHADNTRLEFVESFCSSFMRNTDLRGDGDVRLAGFLSGDNSINLSGNLTANGSLDISTLNTRYTLRNGKVRMIPNEIFFERDTIYDRNGHIGIVNGAIHHDELTNLTFDFDVEAQNLLAYDFHDYQDATFFGTIYGTGNCKIKGRSGRIDFDVNATPEKGSFIEYNAASPDAISDQSFIEWRDAQALAFNDSLTAEPANKKTVRPEPVDDSPTNIHMNFLFNTTPENFTLRLLMDKQSGDYIALNGSGILRASYYNKGSFDMYGTYLIDHGIYKLTIQNVIKKDFMFQPGGTIIFGGDPYNSTLNLQALYTVNGVSLADLQIGNSFKNNNVRVDCMMNINGTPSSPHVEFDLDLPTLGTDAKQMVRSLINSEEEMNQQVIYLLAIGRFYSQGENNNDTQQSQTSLAMQSLLSGTVSQQINSVLSSLTNNSNWNFGANISTGDQGWYNAEYEGILSGRLFNNRLIINGQFGYRDNAATATSSFIGDFDVRYLLFPNGNAAIRVYNQTNDRYFTRNSLNTQGIGLILKRDFNSIPDLFRRKRLNGTQK